MLLRIYLDPQDLELSTAAMAHVYLEKLILKNLVRKHRFLSLLLLVLTFSII